MNRFLKKRVVKWTYDHAALSTSAAFAAADVVANVITVAAHPFITGDMVGLVLTPSTGVTTTAPALSTAYWVINVDSNHISLATSLANAKAGTVATLTAGSGAYCLLIKNTFGVVKSGLTIPSGAIVTNAYVVVQTTFQSLDTIGGNVDLATIGLGIVGVSAGTEDLVVGIAISDASNVWDAGIHGTLVNAPNLGNDAAHDTALEVIALDAGCKIKCSAAGELTMNIAVDPITAGKMDVYIEYMV